MRDNKHGQSHTQKLTFLKRNWSRKVKSETTWEELKMANF